MIPGEYPDEFWQEYCSILYEELKNIKMRDIKSSYKVDCSMKRHKYSHGIFVCEIKFEGIYKVKEDCLRVNLFKKETAFVEKLDMSELRLKELKKFADKILGIETDESNNRELAFAQRFLGASKNNAVRFQRLKLNHRL